MPVENPLSPMLPYILFATILLWAHLAESHTWLRWILYVLLGTYATVLTGLSLLWTYAWIQIQVHPEQFVKTYLSLIGDDVYKKTVGWIAIGLLFISLITWWLLVPGTRHMLMKRLPWASLSSTKPVHTLSVIILIPLIFYLILSLTIFYPASPDAALAYKLDVLPNTVMGAIQYVILATAGGGLLVKRGWGGFLRRLGMAWPSLQRILWAALYGFLLFILFWVLESTLGRMVEPNLFEMQHLFNQSWLPTAEHSGQHSESTQWLLLGLCMVLLTAFAEELFFRGLLQPVFGLPITLLLYTLFHTQFGIGLLLGEVMLIGLFLGMIREADSTTSCIVMRFCFTLSAWLTSTYLPSVSLFQGAIMPL